MPFSDIKGHDSVKFFLKKILSSGELSHSYLFFGPDSVGKRLTAVTFAKALNCLVAKDDACGTCASCVKIDSKNHPDVSFIEVAEKKDAIGIEQIRDLEERSSLRPYEARKKVFIIQDAHLMTEPAANCLLKTLEEPPRDSIIILVTSRPEELLLTVRSRCKQVRFTSLGLEGRIELAGKSGLSEEEVKFLSDIGVMNAPLPLDEGSGIFEYKNKVLEEFISGKDLLDENSPVFENIRDKKAFVISVLASWFRDMLVLKAGAGEGFLINHDRLAELKKSQAAYSPGELQTALDNIQFACFCLERNVGPKLALNDLKLKINRKADV
jgi:DNA polymerase-3 subunit delta'